MDDMMWVWVAIAAVVLVIIIVIVVIVGRRKGKERNRERAAELRSRAAADDQLISTREDRAGQLEVEADAARQKALSEYERAESLRARAEESDEMAARATDEARVLADEAAQSRQSFETAVAEHEETLREADRRDPDVHTDRHGNRIDDSEQAEEEVDPDEEAVIIPVEDPAVDDTSEPIEDEVVVIPVDERLDIGDDYSGDEFAEPDAEYIDPVDHERLDQLGDSTPQDDAEPETVSESEVQYLAEANRLDQLNDSATSNSNGATAVVAGSEDDVEREFDGGVTDGQTEKAHTTHIEPVTEPTLDDADSQVRQDAYTEQDDETGNTSDPDIEYIDPADHDRLAESDEALLLEDKPTNAELSAAPAVDEGPAVDPYGNPVIVEEDKPSTDASELQTGDEPRDDQGRRLDPYGNPIIEEPRASTLSKASNVDEMPVDDPYVTDDADGDLPRDEQGRRLDPYGNPVPENLQ